MAIPVAELGWRQFTFFEKESVHDSKDPSAFKNFYCWKNSIAQEFAVLGERSGLIFKVSKPMELDVWQAYTHQLEDISLADSDSQCLLATMGTDGPGQPSILKVWNLNSWETKSPQCIVSSKVSQLKKTSTSAAVCVSISPAQDFIAVGFADSSVLFSAGDISSDKSMKWKTLNDDGMSMASGCLLGLCVTKADNGKTVVFAIFENGLFSFILAGSEVVKKISHDNVGAQKNCWYFNDLTNQLVVSHQEMVYFYDANSCMDDGFESGRCHALGRGTNKTQLLCVSSYVGVVTKSETKLKDKKQLSVLTLYDINCRYVACVNQVGDAQLFTLGKDVYILQQDGHVFKLVEKPTSVKLDIVVQKHLFDVAISIAKRDNSNELTNIHIKYADYLYNRGDFQNAIQQYVDSIGVLEQSFVIRRFLEGTKTAQLAIFLEALHARNQVNKENTMLLLGAYLKMGEKEKVKQFVAQSSHYKDFDAEGAVKLLRASGNFDLASQLATENNKVLLIFAILVEDLQDFDEAIKQLKLVSGKQVFEVLDAYGLMLLEHKKDEMISMIENAVKGDDADIKVLIKLLNGHPEYLRRLSANDKVKEDVSMRNAVLEHTLERMKSSSLKDVDFQSHIFDFVDHDNYDVALRLGQLHSYPPLVIHVLRNSKKFDELLRYLLRDGDIIDVIQECDQEMIKNMWIELITYLSKKQDIPDKYVIELLKKVTATKLVHPLIVTNILSRNKELPITCVKPYLEHWLTEQGKQIKEGMETIEKNTAKVGKLEQQIRVFDEEVQLFPASKCAVCDLPIQIPAVHFMCKHSLHMHCYESYSDQQAGCPACANSDPDLSVQNKEASSVTIEDLRTEINENTNAMAVIAKFLGKGLFDEKPVLQKTTEFKKPMSSTNPFNEGNVSTNPFDEG